MSKPNIICETYGPKPVVTSFVNITIIGFKVFTCSISSYTDGTDTESLCTCLKSSCESVSSPTADRCVYHAPPADRQGKEGEYFSKAHYHCKQYYSLCPTIMKEPPAFCSTLFIPSSSPSSNLQLKSFACLPDFTIHIKGRCKFQRSLEKEYRNFPTESNLC